MPFVQWAHRGQEGAADSSSATCSPPTGQSRHSLDPARPFRLPRMPSYVGVLGGMMAAPVGCVLYVGHSAVEITVSNTVLSPWLLRSIFI